METIGEFILDNHIRIIRLTLLHSI